MLDRRLITLTREIRGLYRRSCALADRYNAGVEVETRALRQACQGRPSPIAELNFFANVFDRQAAIRTALADPRIWGRTRIVQAVCWLGVGALTWQALTMSGGLYLGLIISSAFGLAALRLGQRLILQSAAFRRKLREQLVRRGVPICLDCGYDLRGQVEWRCPECGRPAVGARPAVPLGDMSYVR